MNQLEYYVNSLFSGYRKSKQISELKDEILSNLEAKVADLTSSGVEYNQAVQMAKDSMDRVDLLIDGNKKIYITPFRTEFLQIAFLYFLIAWILTIPLGIIGMGIMLNYVLLIVGVVLGISFLLSNRNREANHSPKVSIYNVESILRYKKLAWLIWGLFIVVSVLGTTAVQFGSNIWFSRPVLISGPYQFAVVAVHYILPFISIIIPLLFNCYLKLAHKYEVGETDEE